jgi:hypothetical protein
MTWALFAVGVGAGMGAALLGFAIRNAVRAGGSRTTSSAGALRCSVCAINWPYDVGQYRRCPVCLSATDVIAGTGVEPLDPREVRSIRLHHEFDRFYAARHGGAEA